MEHVSKHKRILGILILCYAALKIVLFTLGIQVLSVALEFLEDEAEVRLAAYLAKYIVGTVLVLYTVPSIIAGIGLLNQKKWGLVLALIVGVMSLPVFPLGTGLGVYAIVVFLMDQSSMYKTDDSKQDL